MGELSTLKNLLEKEESQAVYRSIYQEIYLVPPRRAKPDEDPILRLQRFDRKIQPFNAVEIAQMKAICNQVILKALDVGVRVRALSRKKFQTGVILSINYERRKAYIKWDSRPKRSWRNFRDLTPLAGGSPSPLRSR